MPTRSSSSRSARDRRRPRPLLAALLSAIVPGLGHLYGGLRRRGWIFIAVTLVLVIPATVLLVFVLVGGISLSVAVTLVRPFFQHPTLLLVLLGANAILLAFRVAVVVDAYMVARPARTPRHARSEHAAAVAVAMAAILVFTAVPHVWAGRRNVLLYDAFTHDYVTDPGQASLPATTSSTAASVATTSTTAGPSSTVTTQATTTSAALPPEFAGKNRVNILLMGGDAGVGRRGIRTDSMIVVSIDPETGWTAMFGIPRNLIQVPIPAASPAHGAWACPGGCFPLIANEVYEEGLAHPELFPGGPNSGANAAKEIFGYLLGIDIDYFALVDLEGFVTMVDAVGGIDINVLDRIYDENYPNLDGTITTIVIEPGIQHMDGVRALQYARSRHGVEGSDFGRMSHQRCVLQALADQSDPVTLLQQLPTFIPAIEASVKTDIPVSLLPDFIDLLARANLTDIVTIRFMPNAPEFEGTPTSYIVQYDPDGYPVPNRDFIAQTVATALGLPPLEAIRVLNLQPLEDACGPVESGAPPQGARPHS
jgi:LCP family protein required for cell wall assembly